MWLSFSDVDKAPYFQREAVINGERSSSQGGAPMHPQLMTAPAPNLQLPILLQGPMAGLIS